MHWNLLSVLSCMFFFSLESKVLSLSLLHDGHLAAALLRRVICYANKLEDTLCHFSIKRRIWFLIRSALPKRFQ